MISQPTKRSVPAVGAAARPRARLPGRLRAIVQIVCVVIVVLLLRAEVATPVRVSSDSMATTYEKGDVLVVDKLALHMGPPVRGEIVAFRSPADAAMTLKRVVGVPGDRVALRDGHLFLNEVEVAEPFVDYSRENSTYFGPVPVPAGTIFVMGDNRADSIDSRNYGAVPTDAIIGRVRLRLWPWRHPARP